VAPRNDGIAEKPGESVPGANLAALARLEPPAYAAPALRGAETTAETLFRQAMEAYLRHDYSAAISGLQASLHSDPEAAGPRFFLGASQLLVGRTIAGMNDLARVAASKSPFAEEARFDLAKGHLSLGQRKEALELLRTVESQGGDFAARARSLIAEITNSRAGGVE
jgi:TolA-binding protein